MSKLPTKNTVDEWTLIWPSPDGKPIPSSTKKEGEEEKGEEGEEGDVSDKGRGREGEGEGGKGEKEDGILFTLIRFKMLPCCIVKVKSIRVLITDNQSSLRNQVRTRERK